MNLLIKTLEQQIGTSLQDALDDNLLDNEILTINFNKKLVSYSNTVDKRFITLLA